MKPHWIAWTASALLAFAPLASAQNLKSTGKVIDCSKPGTCLEVTGKEPNSLVTKSGVKINQLPPGTKYTVGTDGQILVLKKKAAAVAGSGGAAGGAAAGGVGAGTAAGGALIGGLSATTVYVVLGAVAVAAAAAGGGGGGGGGGGASGTTGTTN